MVDRYWRKIDDVENDIENAMQISSILLKLKGYDNDLGKISTNTGVISTNSGQISTNTGAMSTNSGQISTNTGAISTNLGIINTNKGDISSNIEKLNNMDINVKKDIYKKTFNINNFETTSNHKLIFETHINFKLSKTGVIKIKATYEYLNLNNTRHTHVYLFKNYNISFNETHVDHNSNIVNDEFSIPAIECENVHFIIFLVNLFNDNSKITLNENNIEFIYHDFTKIPKTDYNIDNITSNLEKITANESSISSNSGRISTNEGNISSNSGRISTNEGNISSNSGKISTNEGNISSNLEKINDNSSDISSNLGKIDANISDIASNLEKINDNKDDIIASQTSNVKAFYNLDRIFIYDIENGHETVSSNNYYHIFEKEISHTFIKNSYLEIILKVLTEISNYVLIGYFQILRNFYDENDDLFYTISLSTAMGSINKLSTIKSVFIVPINRNMTKIKIDFLWPKPTQQNGSAKFIIKDINSNKIYVKYFQKTEEMSIKNIQDNLSKVNDIKIYLKNFFNIIYHENDIEITHIFFEKTFLLNAKKDDFIEINFKMLTQYEEKYIQDSKHITTNFIIYDENNIELLSISYDNIDFLSNSNTNILLKNNFSYNFNKDVNKVRLLISFTKRRSYLNINYIYDNNDRLIIKHYGN